MTARRKSIVNKFGLLFKKWVSFFYIISSLNYLERFFSGFLVNRTIIKTKLHCRLAIYLNIFCQELDSNIQGHADVSPFLRGNIV